MPTLHFTLTVDGLNPDTFVVREFDGTSSISQQSSSDRVQCNGYRYDVQLASRDPFINPDDILEKNVQLTLYRNGEISQRIEGIVRSFSTGDTGHHYTFYGLTLTPALERLSLRQNCRLFQQKTVPEIISILLKEMNINDFAFSTKTDFSQREFCVQYRETDLDFLHRLAAEEGLIYSFIFSQGKYTLLFCDSSAQLPSLPDPILYNALSGGNAEVPFISHFEVAKSNTSTSAVLKDYSFKKPSYSFKQEALSKHGGTDESLYEHFDAPGRFKSSEVGKHFSHVRAEFLAREAYIATGKSDVPTLQAGFKFFVQDHFDKTVAQEWLVVSVHHTGSQPQALEEEGGSGATTYSNRFSVIPSQHNWQAEPTTKPIVDGPMIATVVGPENEEIYCDEFGRVKVQFPWDRYSNGDEYSSCWIRVSQSWAGSQYGTIALPRVGHEVIVEFLNGDPDQPIITGRTYHATNTPPYPLPEHKTKTVLRSETHQGEGYNELSFDDQGGNEQVFIHAQKDWDKEIGHDSTTHIKNDEHIVVENNNFSHVKRHYHETIEGDKRNYTAKDQTLIVEGSLHLKTGTVWVNESGSEIHIKAGNKVVIEAGSEITLKAAGSFLKVDPAGVHLVGAGVNLNSGGSAGSGSGFAGQAAELPKCLSNDTYVEEIDKHDVVASQHTTASNVKTSFNAQNEVLFPYQSSSISSVLEVSNAILTIDENDQSKGEALRLKSLLLKQSLTLDKLANRESHSYKKGSNGQEVEYIQQALLELGLDLGKYGADGDYGSTTKRQIKLFQESYQPTNTTHLAYSVGAADGIVGQGTILGLDEALVEGWRYHQLTVNWADSEFGLFLGNVESNNDYSAYNKTKGGLRSFYNTDLTSMTIVQVQELQRTREAFAVGRFQLIPSTLDAAIKQLNIDKKKLFNKTVQDTIFNDYLIRVKRPHIISYLESDGSLEDAIYAWAKEFASAGVEKGQKISKNRIAQGGESYYSGDGLNKAHISPKEMKQVLLKSKIKASK
ncbi:type VI secretion system tip protein VgrG [Vibrio sp. RE86]|uniref:type VI secretion system tip protein TssI/VgrG n=1 Tax=Vibrio sp. RE86 TaxID=2607605 RepID=UPI0014935755|nr:type VI secretion system tip protein TssI/VgrG [Vibrio sp. RE86]NOH78762.1 type VI secretion system tip protein VgrG [Vibrio sp. RE86]